MSDLKVYLGQAPVGELSRDREDRLVFQYFEDWLTQKEALALSRQLPLQREAYKGRPVQAFFGGILPEGEPRLRIAEILGFSESNDFEFLERMGGECAGAVSLWPEWQNPSELEERQNRVLDEDELERILLELPERPLLAGQEGIRLSLAGAQNKLPVLIREGNIVLPLGGIPSTHILKPEPSRFPGLMENEAFCLELARRVGIPVVATTKRHIEDVHYLQIERYDRRMDSAGRIKRLHQEDFCQALGIISNRKYQAEGGPGIRDGMALLRGWSTLPVLDIGHWVDALLFNMLIGNADAHAKNFSFIYENGTRRLAPFYDLVCTLAWPKLSTRMAMKIGSAWEIREVRPEHLRQMAQESRLGWPRIRERLSDLTNRIERELSENTVDSLYTHWKSSEMATRIRQIIGSQLDRFKKGD